MRCSSIGSKIYLTDCDMHTGRYSRKETVDIVEKSGICNYNVESSHHHELRVDYLWITMGIGRNLTFGAGSRRGFS